MFYVPCARKLLARSIEVDTSVKSYNQRQYVFCALSYGLNKACWEPSDSLREREGGEGGETRY